MSLSLKVLGEFSVRDGSGAVLSLPTRKTRALLGYLAVNAGRAQPRERLMALLWSDRGESQARRSLNQALLAIRRLGNREDITLLDSDGERVTLRGDALESDIGRFRTLLDDDPAAAAALYDAPFLDGLSVPDPAFEEWLRTTRLELHGLACGALDQAADAAAEAGDLKNALKHAARLVSLDPLREAAQRRLMRLLYRSDDRAGALRQYQAFVDVLNRELQVEPDVATRTLFAEIRRDTGSEAKTNPSSATPDTPPFPGKPSIAVLPFENLGNNSKFDHLADGLVDDLISTLARMQNLIVASRHSTAVYKGRAVGVQQIARELGVRYVLEGSIRTSGGMLRCAVQLVDTTSGRHTWAERYDRPIDDIFALQDDIVRCILIELRVKLADGDHARITATGTRNLNAWLLRMEAFDELGKVTREATIHARELLEEAHRADPNWFVPYAGIAFCHLFEARYGWSVSREESIRLGIALADRVIEMSPQDALGYIALKGMNVLLGNYDKALNLIEKAVSLEPNNYIALGNLASQHLWMNECKKSVEVYERAIRLTPIFRKIMLRGYGLALLLADRTDRAVDVLERLVQRDAEWLEAKALLAAAYVGNGQPDAAQTTTKRILEQDPNYTAFRCLGTFSFRDREPVERIRNLMIESGLPE